MNGIKTIWPKFAQFWLTKWNSCQWNQIYFTFQVEWDEMKCNRVLNHILNAIRSYFTVKKYSTGSYFSLAFKSRSSFSYLKKTEPVSQFTFCSVCRTYGEWTVLHANPRGYSPCWPPCSTDAVCSNTVPASPFYGVYHKTPQSSRSRCTSCRLPVHPPIVYATATNAQWMSGCLWNIPIQCSKIKAWD